MLDPDIRRREYEKKYNTVVVENAVKFLDYLRLSNSHWQLEGHENQSWYQSWVFRGQADARWSLIPTAWRDKEYVPSIKSWLRDSVQTILSGIRPNSAQAVAKDRIYTVAEQIMAELAMVREFLQIADDIGQATPQTNIPPIKDETIRQVVKDLLEPSATSLHRTIWHDPAIALARHHGIPTRLLDLTYNPLGAAYFAAHDARLMNQKPEYIAVYAIPSVHFNRDKVQSVKVKQSENLYLRAQHGLFVVDTKADEYFIKYGEYPDLLSSLWNLGELVNPDYMMRRLMLPFSEVPELLRLLFVERVTKAHLMPTLDNVALSVKEKWTLALS